MDKIQLCFILYLMTTMGSLTVAAVEKLLSLNVDTYDISVSGVSSGATMAVQFHVAFSSEITGVGVIAGTPYLCTPYASCMQTPSLIVPSALATLTSSARLFFNIDDPSNLENDRIWIFSGAKDSVVRPGAGAKVRDYYKFYVEDPRQIVLVDDMDAAHGHITNNYGGPCEKMNTPEYMSNCNFSASFHLLNHTYENLKEPQPTDTAAGQLHTFDQSEFTTSTATMDTTGYVYVPTGCKDKTKACRLHIAFHGCGMGRELIGESYVRHAGYNEVAELNDIIVIYPQVRTSFSNPLGCWDWWGYSSTLFYPFKSGPQMAAVHRMMKRVSGG